MPDSFAVLDSTRLHDVMSVINGGEDNLELVSANHAQELHSGSNAKDTPPPTSKDAREALKSEVKDHLLNLFKASAGPDDQVEIEHLFDTHMSEDTVLVRHAKAFIEAAKEAGINFSDPQAPKIEDTVIISSGVLKGLTGKVVGNDPGNQNLLRVELTIPGEEKTEQMSFKPGDLKLITESERTAALEATSNIYKVGELKNTIKDVEAIKAVMNKIAPEGWMLSGSSAVQAWAKHLGVNGAREPNDIDIIVDHVQYTNTQFQLNQGFDAKSSSSKSMTFKNEEGYSVDVINSERGFGNLKDRKILNDGTPVLSLEKLLDLKEKHLQFLGNNSSDLNKIKIVNTANDIKFLKEMINDREEVKQGMEEIAQ